MSSSSPTTSTKSTTSSSNTNTTTASSSTAPLHFDDDDEDLPSNVCTVEQLANLPPECLNTDPATKDARPLRHIDDQGVVTTYSLNPMTYSAIFILMVELLERFSFYGIYYTQTLYLTGVYNEDWNAGLTSVDAASFVSISTAVAYTTPFVGALLADMVWGNYKAIVIGSLGLYMPGILLVALTTIPHLLGDHFNMWALSGSVLFLWPMGTGIVKSCVNTFGAKQFHPLLQSSMIEQYYVNFYMCINIGALAGIIIVPILAQTNVTRAYLLPVGLLALGVALFVAGTSRYVITKPRGGLWQQLFTKAPKQRKVLPQTMSPGGTTAIPNIPLSSIGRITILIVPFCIAYSQMPTTFIVQGTVMRKAFGFVDAATMNGLDSLSVLVFGYLTGNILYPWLAERNIKVPTTYKFAIGSCLAALAICWALLVEHWIHAAANVTGETISVLWQAPAYVLIGWGEIFAVSAAYEVAFTASAPETKALASAVNIFCVGGIPNVICIFLYQICQGWFRNDRGDTNLSHLDDYATAHVYKYFCVLLCILLFGVALNLYGPVRRFVEGTEQTAADIIKTPMMQRTPRLQSRKGGNSDGKAFADEESPLLGKHKTASIIKAQRDHEDYLKHGAGPVLNKMGSMRAGPGMYNKNANKNKPIKKGTVHRLYNTNGKTVTTANLVAPKKPMK